MKRSLSIALGLTLLVFAGGAPAQALPGTVVIDQNDYLADGFQLVTTDSTGTPGTGSGSASFVAGPGTSPNGVGSLSFQTASGQGDGSVQLRTTNFTGVALSSITNTNNLSYSTYATTYNGPPGTGQLPYLTLYLNDTGATGTSGADRLYFEPVYSPGENASPLLDTWQSWNLFSGNVYADSTSDSLESFTTYLADNPDAVLSNDPANPTLGSIRFASGFASSTDNFNTNISDFSFGATTYDFELGAPEIDPGKSVLPLALSLGALLLLNDRRRKSTIA